MALVTMKELLERAKSNYRGIGAFSVGNCLLYTSDMAPDSYMDYIRAGK